MVEIEELTAGEEHPSKKKRSLDDDSKTGTAVANGRQSEQPSFHSDQPRSPQQQQLFQPPPPQQQQPQVAVQREVVPLNSTFHLPPSIETALTGGVPQPPQVTATTNHQLQFSTQQEQQLQALFQPQPLQQQPLFPDQSSAAAAAVLAAAVAQQQQQQPAVDPIALATLAAQQQAAAAAAAVQQARHNLIPTHLQASAFGASLNGTPGHSPALILPPAVHPTPPTSANLTAEQQLAAFHQQQQLSLLLQQQQQQQQLAAAQAQLAAATPGSVVVDPIPRPIFSVQDLPMTPPVYNGVNPSYPGLRVLNSSPPVFCVDSFLTPQECQFLMEAAEGSFTPAPVVGKGSGEISPSRTSSTCYLAREDLPDLLRKISMLTGKPIEHCELPQVGRYLPSQQYLQHFDAFDLATEDGRRFASNGGQRTITCLIYLNDVPRGGATRFPALGLDVQPRQGMCLVFFPATVNGLLDKMALHAALPAVDTKFVSQVWIRQSRYTGTPTKRLNVTMGVPFRPLETVTSLATATPAQPPQNAPGTAAQQPLQMG